jgi:pimeloyl-ACP methyl ester carboxylesterase
MMIRPLVAAALAAALQVAFVDRSPHEQRFVTVDAGTRLELLDWGGSGPVLVLLAQMGQTAHIYDEWAPALTPRFHVLGVTRRGFGASSVPDTGYSADRLGQDVLDVLDAEHLDAPLLVGNGFAGEELSWVATHVTPRRLGGLVYLDAAYDRTHVAEEAALMQRLPAPPRPSSPPDTSSVAAFAKWSSTALGVSMPASEIAQLARIGDDGRVSGERAPAAVRQQILAGIVETDYLRIRVPTLAIYAVRTATQAFPACAGDAAPSREVCHELQAWTERQRTESKRRLKTIRAPVHVIEYEGASPFVFLSNGPDVVREIDRFAAALR